jgi:hypothetical protein
MKLDGADPAPSGSDDHAPPPPWHHERSGAFSVVCMVMILDEFVVLDFGFLFVVEHRT